MFDPIEALTVFDAFVGTSRKRRVFHNRPSHALIIKISGNNVYRFENETITLDAGRILFIPAGASYTVRRLSEEAGRYALINFHGEMTLKKPTLFHSDNFSATLSAFNDINRAVLVDHEKQRLVCLSAFYKILSLLSRDTDDAYLDSEKIDWIKPALSYVEEHMFDPSLKVEELHRLCGISDVYFRKIFAKYMGRPPKKYITEKRLERAKSMLEEGNYGHLYEVAEATGFSDPLYFSRVFKQQYGVAPSRLRI